MPNLEKRARMYAALGDPTRLAICDRLVLGDVSPGQIANELGMSTNHLAHHLRALEAAGLIRRVRSEGDRRRTYVQLVLDDPLVAAVTTPGNVRLRSAAERVVFVCTRNSARSQLAAAAWARASSVPGTSAGTHPAARVHPRAVRVGRRHGLSLDAAGTADVVDVARPGDLLVAVCDNAREELPLGQVELHWAVPDPVRVDTDEAFETAYEQITRRVERLAHALDDASSSTT